MLHATPTGPGLVRVKQALAPSEDFAFRLYNFDIGSAHIKREFMDYIYHYGSRQLTERLQEDPQVGLLVQGIMSAPEGVQFGGQLGSLRAHNIGRFLAGWMGVPQTRFKIRTRPIMENDAAIEHEFRGFSAGGARNDLGVLADSGDEIAYRRAVLVIAGKTAEAYH